MPSETALRDKRFDEERGWVWFRRDNRFAQRFVIEGDVFYSETVMNVRCELGKAAALIAAPWDWWDRGKVTNIQRHGDSSFDMDLKPISRHFVKIHMRVSPPMLLEDVKGRRVLISYSHHFEGAGTMDVFPNPGLDTVVIRGRCHAVRSRVPVAPILTVVKTHLRAEAGTLQFPFPKGTGWVGLYRRLEPV